MCHPLPHQVGVRFVFQVGEDNNPLDARMAQVLNIRLNMLGRQIASPFGVDHRRYQGAAMVMQPLLKHQ